ncbi:hypothetical protein [Bacillus sp. AFS031507]|uniref:hypothetical protein n=1 Tax=Bacillus sp. AFS031507 TaxID=2033496 RepID=UPI000BFC885D|nr:hypothetical protein [Bacillus sp. AFS031507]PGY06410.1 hypothetical protein COE25_27700 [Bacillus sp. AFS031507]
MGQGGRQPDIGNELRLKHGAGVVGIAGGSGNPIPAIDETGGVGVYAQGAEAELRIIRISGNDTIFSGPPEPGPGVLGRGGKPIVPTRSGGTNVPPPPPLAAGVIGLAGDTPIPPYAETGGNGIYGKGPVGILGYGTNSRGGRFISDKLAQVQLVPHKQTFPQHSSDTVTPTVISVQAAEKVLPTDGEVGDFLTIIDEQEQCTLWLCVKKGQWAQVLLGPSFTGQG